MSTMQRLTLIGFNNIDPTLFDTLELPEGYDKETFIDSLLLEHGEKCVMYTDPEFFKLSIKMWSRKWRLELSRIYEALIAEYNPIYNYDRYEEYVDIDDFTHRSKYDGKRTAKDNPDYTTTNKLDSKTVTDVNTDVISDTNEDKTVENLISADNSSSYQPQSKTIENGGKTTESTDGKTTATTTGTPTTNVKGETQNLVEINDDTTNDNDHRKTTHNAHLFGNIGVTRSDEMVSSVVRQRYEMNLYGVAAQIFANELLLGIY